MKTDHEIRGAITGNDDRLDEEGLDLVVLALSLDMKGDCGLRSNAGIYDVAGQFEPIERRNPFWNPPQISSSGKWTFPDQQPFVKTPKNSGSKSEMGDRMLDAAARDKVARRVRRDLGARKLMVLWRCYIAPLPEGLRASLAAFSDLAPLAPDTTAAISALKAAREKRASDPASLEEDTSREHSNTLRYCQGLSARILRAQQSGAPITESDSHAMQAICGEAEPILAGACRAVKASMRRDREEVRKARAARKQGA